MGTVPTRESDFGAIRSPVEVPMSQKRGKKELLGLFAPLRSAPQASKSGSNLDIFPQNLGNYVRVYPLYELG